MSQYFNGDNMKRLMIILAIMIVPLILLKNNEEETIIIPNDSIRIRVIANSNSINDQYEKLEVRKNLQLYLEELLKDAKTKEETVAIINKNLINIDRNVNGTLKELNSLVNYNVKYGNNYFPEEEYKGIKYEEGYYDSLVITLGKGEGNNWWCVLFPPLCLMETDENISNVEYELFVNEVLSKYK